MSMTRRDSSLVSGWFGPRSAALTLGASTLLCVSVAVDPTPAASQVDSTTLTIEAGADPLDTPAPVSLEQSAVDADIELRLQAAFDRIPGLSGITVEVEAGVVQLQGQVLEATHSVDAEVLARSFDGALVVLNRIELSTSLSERLNPTWDRLRDFFLNALARGPLLIVALLIVGVAWLLGLWVRTWRLPSFVVARNPFLHGLAQRFLQAVVLMAGLVIALQLVNAVALFGALAGTAGLAGLTIGFAFKDIVENYLAGVLLSLRHPFATNDHVVLDGNEGKVVRLTWSDTILMTLDGNHLRIPNARIFASTVLNYTRNPKRRFSFDFGVGPDDDLVEARRIGIATLSGMMSVLEDPAPQALVLELGDSSVQMRYLAWVDQQEHSLGRARSEAIRLVKLALDDAGISLPSPEYRVVLTPDGNGVALTEEGGGAEGPPVTADVPSGVTERAREEAAGLLARPPESRLEEDTESDDSVERQILADQASSTEENLLTGGEPDRSD